jgi:glycolate oxidase iron-sulfur subunit
MSFLAARGLRGPLNPVARSVAHAPPCHMLHVLGESAATDGLLRRVPGLAIRELPDTALCCGAGGAAFARQPGIGAALGRAKAEAIAASGAGWVLAGNPGCLLQIGGALRAHGVAAQALHPARVLRESLGAPLPD